MLFSHSFSGRVFGLAFSKTGFLAAASSYELKVWKWKGDTAPPEEILYDGGVPKETDRSQLIARGERFYGLDFSPDGHELAVGRRPLNDPQASVELWDLSTRKVTRRLPARLPWIWGVAYSPDGSRLAAAVNDGWNGYGFVRIWDVDSGQELPLRLKGHRARVVSLAFNGDGSRVATGSLDQTVKVWDAKVGHELFTLRGHHDAIWAVAYTPKGDRLVSGDSSGVIKLWDGYDGQEPYTLRGHTAATFSRDGLNIATVGTEQERDAGYAKVWSLGGGEERATFEEPLRTVRSIAFSRDSRLLAVGSGRRVQGTFQTKRGELKVWNLREPSKPRHRFAGYSAAVTCVAFGPQDRLLASSSGHFSHRGEVKLWDLTRDREADIPLEGHAGITASLAFSEDGRYLAWGTVDWPEKEVDPGRSLQVPGAVFSVNLWDLKTGKRAATLPEVVAIDLAFSADSQFLAAGCRDHSIRIWNSANGEQIRVLRGHRHRVHGIAFSPDSERIASASYDTTVKFWDLATGKPVLTLDQKTFVDSVVFSHDGYRVASASQDGTIKVWDGTPAGEPAP